MRAPTTTAWLAAIRAAEQAILFENYIFRDDAIGREFRDALVERAHDGVRVCVLRDWLGCLGQSARVVLAAACSRPAARCASTTRRASTSPFGWLSRDHRKLLVVDRRIGFVGGLCVSAKWLGDPDARHRAVARHRGRGARSGACSTWSRRSPTSGRNSARRCRPSIVEAPRAARRAATPICAWSPPLPNIAGLYRLDQLIAGIARTQPVADRRVFRRSRRRTCRRWVAAARDGVDVRLLVPGSSDIPAVGSLSRAGYRPLLEAGVRVFEWNGSMLHAKTAVADGRWARVGSSNLNLASWIGNCEIDVAIEDEAFARAMEAQYLDDLQNATEIVLGTSRRARRTSGEPSRRAQGGSSGRAAAGALRLANSIGAAITNRRVLGPAESGPLLVAGAVLLVAAVLAFVWPRVVAWPLAVLALWVALTLIARFIDLRRKAAAPHQRG